MLAHRPHGARAVSCGRTAQAGRVPQRPAATRPASPETTLLHDCSRRELLAALGVMTALASAPGAKAAADPYNEMRAALAARSSSAADRGIRERLATEAANAPKAKKALSGSRPVAPSAPSSTRGGLMTRSSGGSSLALPAKPTPGPGLRLPFSGGGGGGGSSKPVVPPRKPAPAAAAVAAGGSSVAPLGPVAQAVAVLGVVGVGASVVTSAATSKPKPRAVKASAVTPAAKAPVSRPGTGKVAVTSPSAATTKVAVASKAATTSTTTRSTTKKVAGAASASSGGTVKQTIRAAIVNEAAPDEPTDAAVAGLLGFALLLGGFFVFGLPQATTTSAPDAAAGGDQRGGELVRLAREGATEQRSSSYAQAPLFRSARDGASGEADAGRRVISAAAPAPAPAATAPAGKQAPAKASSVAAAVKAQPAKPAKQATAAPAATQSAAAPQQQASDGPGSAGLILGGVAALAVGAIALGGNKDDSSSGGGGGDAAAAPTGSSAAAEAAATAATAAQTVGAVASAAAAASAPASSESTTTTTEAWSSETEATARAAAAAAPAPPAAAQPLPTTPAASVAGAPELEPERLRGVFEALLANPGSRELMRRLLASAGQQFDEATFATQLSDPAYYSAAIAPVLRRMPPAKLAVLADLQDPSKLQELVRSVNSLAADAGQLDAVTAELSGDVRSTVETIRSSTPAPPPADGS